MLELQAAVDRSLEYFKVELQTKRALRDEQWRFKRDACLKALAVADAMLSNYNYPNVSEGEIVKQDCSTEEVRGCLNALACSCESSEVIEQLKKILFDSVSPDSIIDLRTAVRKELGFGLDSVDNDRERAFVGKVCSDPKIGESRKKLPRTD